MNSDHGKAYRQLKKCFETTWSLFTKDPVLSTDAFDFHDDARSIIELINLAKLGSWLVEDGLQASIDADTYFLALLDSQISELPTVASELYLSVATQKAVKKLFFKQDDQRTDSLLQEALLDGLEQRLRSRHDGELTEADKRYIGTIKTRKIELETVTKDKIDADALKHKYPREELLRQFTAYAKIKLAASLELGDKFGVPMEIVNDTAGPEPFTADLTAGDLDLDDLSSFFEKTASGLVQNALAGLSDQDAAQAGEGSEQQTGEKTTNVNGDQTKPKADFMTDYKELEALVAESTSNYVKTTLHGLSPVPYQPTVPTSTAESMAAQLPYLAQLQQHQAQNPYYTYTQPMQEQPPPQQPQPTNGENLPPNQTFPSAILYDKARQAALSKSSAHTRREGLHSTRRPWTQEEEKALMAGLDMVKGPHWSQILTLFGQSGTISDILKDRTQVQLKDKARNLKLFFLKTNSEMPYYLQAVTGELKTRAPTQAARKEAEERARLNSEEDQAKLQGIMALAGGLQHHTQHGRGAGQGATPGQQALQAAQNRAGTAAQHSTAATIARSIANSNAAQNRPGMQAATQQALQAVGQAPPRPQGQLPPNVPRPQGQAQFQRPAGQHLGQQQRPQGQNAPGQGQQQFRPQGTQANQAQGQGQGTPQGAGTHIQHAQQQQQAGAQIQRPPSQAAQGQNQAASTPITTAQSTPRTVTPHQTTPVATVPLQASTTSRHATASPANNAGTTPASTSSAQPSQHQHQQPTQPAQANQEAKNEAPLSQEQQQEAENAAEAALLEGLQAAVAQALS